MKKILLISNLFTAALLGALLLKGCSQPQSDESKNTEAEVTGLTSTAIVIDYSGDTTFKSLTIPQAALLKANYLKNLQPVILNTKHAAEPTEYIEYSLDDLKNLVWYIEYYAKATGKPVNTSDLGVNVHFGQFPQDVSGFEHLKKLSDKERKDLAGKQMIYFMPTIKTANGRMEFNPKRNYQDIKSGKIKDFVSLKTHHGNELSEFKQVDYPRDSPAMDLGGYRPPY